MPAALPIAVIIPAYNAAATIGDALDGIAAQTRQPVQTIVVDDGSTDATASIARGRGAQVLCQPNAGVAAARNAGLRASASPWVAFLDADDRWRPDYLEAQWRMHERDPQVLVLMSDYAFVIEGRLWPAPVMQSLRRYRAMPRQPRAGGSFVARGELLRALVIGNFVIPSTMLVDRRIFSEFGAYFAEANQLPSGPDFFVGEDYEWLLRVLRFSDVLLIERPLVDYRRSATSLSAPGGRLRYGDVKLGEFVCERPERYPPQASEDFRRLRPRHLREAGGRFLVSGDAQRARAMFAQAFELRASPRTAALYALSVVLATSAGARIYACVLTTWRLRIRPLLRARRSA